MKLLTGNSNKILSKNIAKYLKSKLVNSSIRKFADGEIYIEINENIRGNSIFIILKISFANLATSLGWNFKGSFWSVLNSGFNFLGLKLGFRFLKSVFVYL